jgi:Methyltransferase small domain
VPYVSPDHVAGFFQNFPADYCVILNIVTWQVREPLPMETSPSFSNNPREEIISLLRGAFAAPVISFLGRRGYAEALLSDGLCLRELPTGVHSQALVAVFRYLVGLGLLEEAASHRFMPTELGRKVFERWGAFCVLDSYNGYFWDLDWTLASSTLPHPTVDRERNTIGSGQFHARKFFPLVLSHLEVTPYDHLTDLGCGDGTFIEQALKVRPSLSVSAVDLSEQAILLVQRRLSSRTPPVACSSVVCNALEVSSWAPTVAANPAARHLITIWFVLHEIFDGCLETLVSFFHQIHDRFPNATVAFAELFRLSAEELVSTRRTSIMPEYVLFHELSGQHLLTADQLSDLLSQIPYQVAYRRTLDFVSSGFRSLPSNTVCILSPRAEDDES